MSALFKYFPIQRKSPRIQPLSTFAHTLTESTAQTTHYVNVNTTSGNSFTNSNNCKYINTTQSKSFYKTKLVRKPTTKTRINFFYKRNPSPFLSTTHLSRNIPHKQSSSLNKVSSSSNNQLQLNRSGFAHMTKRQIKSTTSLLKQATQDNKATTSVINKAFIPKPPSKYPIIFNPKAKVPLCDYSDITRRINKINKLKMQLLTKESQMKFEEPISLVKKSNFSKEFQLLFEHNKQLNFDLDNLKHMNIDINISNNILVGRAHV